MTGTEANEWTDDLSDGVVTIRRLEPDDAPAFAQAFRVVMLAVLRREWSATIRSA